MDGAVHPEPTQHALTSAVDVLSLMRCARVCLPLQLRAGSLTDTLLLRVTAVARADNNWKASACRCCKHTQSHRWRPQAMVSCLTGSRPL